MSGPPRSRAGPAAAAAQDVEVEPQRIDRLVHDLNSPLSALSMQLFLRRRSLSHPTPQDLHFLEVLDRNVERIRTIVASMRPPTALPPTEHAVQATQPSGPRRAPPRTREAVGQVGI